MTPPITATDFLSLVEQSGLLHEELLVRFRESMQSGAAAEQTCGAISRAMVREGLLTSFQARKLEKGRFRGFFLSGKYKILEQIGEGGMGRVLLCEHLILRRLVAVKLMTLSSDMFPGAIERFLREARASASLDHRNITRVFDVEQSEAGPCLVMEYVDGVSLYDLVHRQGPLSLDRTAHYIAQSATGLQHAHEAGLVHRDVKPGNILLDRSGTIKLLDLGLARFFDAGKDEGLTQKFDERAVLGTADYIAPEQAVNSSRVDIRADIYSLGCTFYFLLCGKPPFDGGSMVEKLMCHQGKEPPPIRKIRSEVPEPLVAVVDKMLAKRPADRYQTPAEIVPALERWTKKLIAGPKPEEMQQLNPLSFKLGLSPPPTMSSGKYNANSDSSRAKSEKDTHRDSDVRPATVSEVQHVPMALPDSSYSSPIAPSMLDLPAVTPSLIAAAQAGRRRPLWQVFAASAVGIMVIVGSAIALASWYSSSQDEARMPPSAIARNQDQNETPPPAITPVATPTTTSVKTLRAGGSSFIAPLMEHWTPLAEKHSGIKLEYASLGSSKGVEGVLNRFLDFGCTDAFLTDKQLAEADGAIVHIPLAMGAVVPTYNLVDAEGQPLQLRFTGPLLANIYLGRVKKWNDSTIAVNNPGKKLPELEIQVVHRSDGSGTTFIWTDYLSKVSAEWKSRVGAGNKVEWPIGTGGEKNGGVADAVSGTIGAIGYVELSFALANSLQVGQVKNRSGEFIEPSIEGVTAAASGALAGIPADLRYSLTDAPGRSSYPISGTCWAVAFVDQPPAKRTDLIKFLRWATHEGQAHVRDLRYAPLPDELKDRVDAAIERLVTGR